MRCRKHSNAPCFCLADDGTVLYCFVFGLYRLCDGFRVCILSYTSDHAILFPFHFFTIKSRIIQNSCGIFGR